jgi:hypothetical protein
MAEEKEQGGAGAGRGAGAGAAVNNKEQQEVLLVHSQVRRIKKEDEEARERLLKLRLLETRPAAAAGGVAWRAPRSLSPLRRAGSAIPVPVPVPVGE